MISLVTADTSARWQRGAKQRGTSRITALCLTAGLLAAGCEYPVSPTTHLGNEINDPGEPSPNVVSVVVTPSADTLVSVRQSVRLSATALDSRGNAVSGKTFAWTSSDTSVASVNASGRVTAVAEGTVAIVATADGISGGAIVFVDLHVSTTDRILVDASKDGGAWWYPQFGSFSETRHHQGKRLADYLRSLGFQVDELGRDVTVTDDLLDQYTNVIRAGEWGNYLPTELGAYARFLERETSLILLSDHRNTDAHDQLAEMLGVTFGGAYDGPVTRLAPHPITDRIGTISYIAGAAVTSFDPSRVEILGWVQDTIPVMGIIRSNTAKIFFFGDTNAPEAVPQPFIDNLVRWAFR